MTNILDSVSRWLPVRKVSVCDERPAARNALSRIISDAIQTVSTVNCSPDSAALLEQYAATGADLVLIGVRDGRTGGADAVTGLLARYPLAPVIVYGAITDGFALATAVGRGARGFLVWDADRSVITPARQHATRSLAGSHFCALRTLPPRLTERELHVLKGMTNGLSNSEIGQTFDASEDTVKTHARSMFHKLGARDRAHAVALGLRSDLVA